LVREGREGKEWRKGPSGKKRRGSAGRNRKKEARKKKSRNRPQFLWVKLVNYCEKPNNLKRRENKNRKKKGEED